MKSVNAQFTQYQELVDTMADTAVPYAVISHDNPNAFFDEKNICGISQQIGNTELQKIIYNSLSAIPSLKMFAKHTSIRNLIVMTIFSKLGYTTFISKVYNDVYIFDTANDISAINNAIFAINEIFQKYFNTTFLVEKRGLDVASDFRSQVKDAKKYYIETHGTWLTEFIDSLGDDISKFSFIHFLKARIKSHVLYARTCLYPILPPPQTAQWRKERYLNPPVLPYLCGCTEDVRNFFFLHSFIYEQYGISGIVEARQGDCVIDAGAYIGDTALYFSNKVGQHGKVFGFEVIPESVEQALVNIQRNNRTNIEMIELALADTEQAMRFNVANVSSNSRRTDEGALEVQAIPLDVFVEKRGITVNFLKMDVEGGEMDVLRGARETIRRQKPTCGIALYHRQRDFHEIPTFLKELCPEYTFFFRCEAEPVLFATVKT